MTLLPHRSRAVGAVAALALASLTACSDGGPIEVKPWGGLELAGRSAIGATGVTSLVSAELTGDGRRDLLLVTRTPNAALRIMPGTAGGFGAAQTVQGLNDPIRAAVAELNGDGRADLLGIGHFDNGFRAWPSAQGGFGQPAAFALANHGRSLVVADLNGDGRDDVIAIHDGSGQPVTVTTYRSDGAGGLAKSWEHRTPYSTSQGACAGDFDGDGRVDLAVVTGDPRAPTLVFRGQGNGALAEPQALAPVSSVAGEHDGAGEVACADLNGDGRTDLVTAHSASDYPTGRDMLSVRLGGATGLGAGIATPVAAPREVSLADLDRDGRMDLIATHPEAGQVSHRPGRGDGTFGAAVTISGIGEPGRATVGDFDGDGWADVVVVDRADGSVVLLRNRGR